MKIALIGYGKMGQMIEKISLERGHSIVARMNSTSWNIEALQQADMCIEFSQPDCLIENIRKMAALKKNVIIGTTGWNEKMEWVQSIVKENQIGVLYSSNFSIGIHLFLEILKQTAKVMNGVEDYDVAGVEYHHNKKIDSPSGTAKEMAKTIVNNMTRIADVPFSSIRCGSIPGTHTVLFDSSCDTISLTHEARNREGFAKGAVYAAEWLNGRKGFYTFADFVQEILQKGSS